MTTKYHKWLAERARGRDLEHMTKTHRCGECAGLLTVRYDGLEHQIQCPRNKNHTRFVKAGDLIIERIKGMTGTDEQIQEAINQYLNREVKDALPNEV